MFCSPVCWFIRHCCCLLYQLGINAVVCQIMSASSANSSHHQQQQRGNVKRSNDGSPTSSSSTPGGSYNNNSSNSIPSRLQPIRATVPYQLLRGNQQSPTRSPSSFSVGSLAGPTSPGCSSPTSPTLLLANPAGNGSVDGRLFARQRPSPPDNRGSPERCPNSPVFRGITHDESRTVCFSFSASLRADELAG